MTKPKITYGIIGFGNIALTRIAKEGFCLDAARFEPSEETRLKGVTSRSQTRRADAEGLGLTWYDSMDDLLGDSEIDAIFVASNNLSHFGHAAETLQAGKHCIVEKPITTTLGDAIQLVTQAKERGLSLAVDHMMLKNAFNRKAAELVKQKVCGEINDISLHIEFLLGAKKEDAASWRCSNPEEKGGPIGDVGSHCLYMAEYLMGSRITSISCVYTPRTLDIAVENGAIMHIVFENGTSGSIRAAFNQPRGGYIGTARSVGYEIYGERGIIRSFATLHQFSGHPDEPVIPRLEIDDGKHVESIAVGNIINIYRAVIDEHALSIREGKPMDGSDAVHNLKLVLTAYESASRGGKQIAIA